MHQLAPIRTDAGDWYLLLVFVSCNSPRLKISKQAAGKKSNSRYSSKIIYRIYITHKYVHMHTCSWKSKLLKKKLKRRKVVGGSIATPNRTSQHTNNNVDVTQSWPPFQTSIWKVSQICSQQIGTYRNKNRKCSSACSG